MALPTITTFANLPPPWSLAQLDANFASILANWNSGGGGGGGSAVPGVRICVITDSTGAVNNNMPAPWTSILQSTMNGLGAPCSVYSVGGDGLSFNRALNGYASFQFGTNTAVQQCISYAPQVVIVALGVADLLFNIENRALAQVEADALALFTALRNGLPTATIVYMSELWYDSTNYATPGTTLLNQGVVPYFMALNTAGILANFWSSEILGSTVSSTAKTNFGNWLLLDAYIKGLSPTQGVNTSFTQNYWKIARMGCLNSDMIHPNEAGRRLLAGYAVKGFKGAFFSTLFPTLMSNNMTDWDDPDALFSNMFAASGAAWVEQWAADSEAVRVANNFSIRPYTWYQPYPAHLQFITPTFTGIGDPFWWLIENAPPFAQVALSIDGGAFSNLVDAVATAYGTAYAWTNGQAILASYAAGAHTLRFQLLFTNSATISNVGTLAYGGGGSAVATTGFVLSPVTWTLTDTPTVVNIHSGGTNAQTAANARTNLGLTTSGQPGFTNVSSGVGYAAGWSAYTTGGLFPAGYMQDNTGKVTLHGSAQYSSGGSTTVFTLPVGMRPSGTIAFACPGNGAFCIVQVTSAGVVSAPTGSSPVGFDNVSFWPL
jgi:hypothetical protein